MKRIVLLFSALLICAMASAQPVLEKKSYKVNRTYNSPVIDGNITDEEWAPGEWDGDFIQYEPLDGQMATQKTEFKVLFDENNVYVAIKAYDNSPDSIVKRITRRDNCDGDQVGIAFDSYHDLRTAFIFFVSVAGSKQDMIMSNDGDNEDSTWDPIWFVKTRVFDWGYGAEMKIPLSQLRFKITEGGSWGMTVVRYISRNQETSFWSYIPRNTPGIVHQFGEATGFEGIVPKKQADITPFAVASFEHSGKEEGNPFATGHKEIINGGIDGKIGLTNNMTLDFTINPDFGQVEADPSEVNLTAYETFFKEKRPFFVEGKNITSFSTGIGDGDLGNDNLFYTRRIGRSPHLGADTDDNEYSRSPLNTSIIGATKITGKTSDGLSIGIVEAVTSEEKAEIDSLGERTYQTVEPLTNYFIARIIKDINNGNTIIGGGYTNTHRFLDGTGINSLTTTANTGGIDLQQYFADKKWFLSVTTSFSMINGSRESIERLQRSSVHFYQRPDADYVTLDTNRKSLGGYGGNIQFGKIGGNWRFAVFGLFKSPGFDLNDVGYLRRADDMSFIFWSSYRINNPFWIFRNMRFNTNIWEMTDWGGTTLDLGGNIQVSAQFKNLWYLGTGTNLGLKSVSNTMLRGGPSMATPASFNYWIYANTNESKKFYVEANYYSTVIAEDAGEYRGGTMEFSLKPGRSFTVSVAPSFSYGRDNLQYVTAIDYEDQERYILGRIEQKIAMMSLRMNYTITPDLTIQYWGQPFLASMKYSDFKRVTTPDADNYNDRFHMYSGSEISYISDENVYNVDEDNNGTTDYSFDNPDMNFDEFLSNLVIRWEYRSGSALYLVWSQSRQFDDPSGEFAFSSNINNLFTSNKPRDIFLIKFTYRFGLH